MKNLLTGESQKQTKKARAEKQKQIQTVILTMTAL